MKMSRKVVVKGVQFGYNDMLNDHCHPDAAELFALSLIAQAGIDLTGQDIVIEEFCFNSFCIYLKVDGKEYWLKPQLSSETEEEILYPAAETQKPEDVFNKWYENNIPTKTECLADKGFRHWMFMVFKEFYMNKQAEDLLRKYETCYAYNDFNYYYKLSMPRHECEEFVAKHNQYKGGHWEVRRKVDYEEHFQLLIDRKCLGDGS